MFKELYDPNVSTNLISHITDSLKEWSLEWQNWSA